MSMMSDCKLLHLAVVLFFECDLADLDAAECSPNQTESLRFTEFIVLVTLPTHDSC